jgi:hypothetical protein
LKERTTLSIDKNQKIARINGGLEAGFRLHVLRFMDLELAAGYLTGGERVHDNDAMKNILFLYFLVLTQPLFSQKINHFVIGYDPVSALRTRTSWRNGTLEIRIDRRLGWQLAYGQFEWPDPGFGPSTKVQDNPLFYKRVAEGERAYHQRGHWLAVGPRFSVEAANWPFGLFIFPHYRRYKYLKDRAQFTRRVEHPELGITRVITRYSVDQAVPVTQRFFALDLGLWIQPASFIQLEFGLGIIASSRLFKRMRENARFKLPFFQEDLFPLLKDAPMDPMSFLEPRVKCAFSF